jgi:DNA polymerase-1
MAGKLRLDAHIDGLLFKDTPATRKELANRVVSDLRYPETGWKPPQEFPNIQHAKWIGFDVETYDPEIDDAGPGWARDKGHIVGISLAVDGGKWYFPMRHEIEKHNNLDPQHVLNFTDWALKGSGVKIGANATYDVGWLKQEGVVLSREQKIYDVQHAEALINETSDLALDDLGWKYLRRGKNSSVLEEWILAAYKPPKTKWRKDIYRSPPSLVGPYAEDDADMPAQILIKQWQHLATNGLLDLFYLECDLIQLFVDMRFQGVTVDVEKASKLSGEFQTEAKQLMYDTCKAAGVTFDVNPNSGESLARAFDFLGIPYNRTEPTPGAPNGNPSFTADFMKTVTHPFAKGIQRVKHLEKLDSTFLRGGILTKHVNSKVYCSFSQLKSDKGGARTGRLASDKPNLQNIPTRTEEGKRIRECFTYDLYHENVRDGDYSQIEYRMLAHYATGAGSDELRQRYNNDPNLDYHNLVGSLIALMPGLEEYATKEKRSYVKNVNFGIVYGVGIAHLCEMLGLSYNAGKSLLDQIHTAIPFAKQTMEDLSIEVNRTGIVKTILGRISHFDEWEPEDWNMRSMPLPLDQARREWHGLPIMRAYLYRALNYKLQGSAADMIKKGMRDCYKAGIFDVTGVPRLQVHDELYFSDPGGVPDEAWRAMQRTMETCMPQMSIPIRFDMSLGKNWREAH